MKKYLITICCFASISLFATDVLPEVKAAYYYPLDSHFRNIYSETGLYSIETSVQTWDQLYSFASLGYLYTSGRSKGNGGGDRTTFEMIPIGLGLKYLFETKYINPYLGLGMVVAYTDIDNHSKYVKRNQSKWGVGGLIKSGFLTYLNSQWFLDLFLDYTYLKIDFNDHPNNVVNHKADISGLSIGGGIGYKF